MNRPLRLTYAVILLVVLAACGEVDSEPAVVTEAPVISSFSASPNTLEPGQSSTLTWELAGGEATSVTVDNDATIIGSSASVSPSETTTYTLTVQNEGGIDSKTQTVDVTPSDDPTPAPPISAPIIESFTATPDMLEAGQSSTLTWTLSGDEATSITIDNGVGEVTGDTAEVSPTATTTYTLTATNEGGDDTETVTVVVSEAAIVPPSDDDTIEAADVEITGETDGVTIDGPFVIIDVGYILGSATYPEAGYSAPELSIPSDTTANGTVFAEDGEIFYLSDGEDISADSFEYTLSVTNESTGEALEDGGTITLDVQ